MHLINPNLHHRIMSTIIARGHAPRKWTAGETAAMFEKHGLDGPIWTLPSHRERF